VEPSANFDAMFNNGRRISVANTEERYELVTLRTEIACGRIDRTHVIVIHGIP